MMAMWFVRLSEEDLASVSSFTSGNPDLDEYLRTDALLQQKMKPSLIYFGFNDILGRKELVGYMTLLADCIRFYEDLDLKAFSCFDLAEGDSHVGS